MNDILKNIGAFLIAATVACAAVLLSGCAAFEAAADRSAQTVNKAYDITTDQIDRADNFKGEVARNNLKRTEQRIDFASGFGRDIDRAGVNWLDAHTRRVANFICDLHQRNITLGRVPTAYPTMHAVLTCIETPEAAEVNEVSSAADGSPVNADISTIIEAITVSE